MKWLISCLLTLALFVFPGFALAQETVLVIAAGQHVGGDVATVAQDIRVDGAVDGDVTSWSGAITIAGVVGGDVVSYGGAVTVTATGHVGGHILASGNTLRLEGGAVVAGQKIDGGGGGALASLVDLLDPSAGVGGNGAVGRVLFGAVLGVLLVAFCLLYLAFWPGRIAIAGATLQRLTGRALALGLLTTLVLALAVLPLAGLLLASVVGVPLLIILLALALALYVYGLAVLARTLSTRRAALPEGSSPLNAPTIAIVIALALLVAVVTALAPLWGLALFYLVASPGLGAVILSRGGMAVPLAAGF